MLRCLIFCMKMPDAKRKVAGALSCEMVNVRLRNRLRRLSTWAYTEHMFGDLGEQESGDVTNG